MRRFINDDPSDPATDMTNRVTIEQRQEVLINTDPQRRCYDGAHFSSEWQWTRWAPLEENVPTEIADERLAFWQDLNKIATSARGRSASREFRIIPPRP